MECTGEYETLLHISLVSNLLAFSYTFFRKLFVWNERRRSKRIDGWKVFQCGELRNRVERCGAVKSFACFDLICNTISLIMATYVVITTEITAKPYFTYNTFINWAFSFQLSTIFVNVVINILVDHSERCPFHVILRNILCTAVVSVIISMEEATFIGVIIMFMSGSNIADNVMIISQQSSDKLQKRYQVFRTVAVLFHVIFLLLVPAVMFIVPVSFTSEHFFDMSPMSISGFFIAMSFLLLYNAWVLKSLTCEFVQDMSNITIQKRVVQLTNMPTVVVWQNDACINKRQAAFVQVSKTRFIRKLGEIPTTMSDSRSPLTIGKAMSTVNGFETIDLN